MSYHFSIKNRSLFFTSMPFYKLKSRREVVYWLNSVVSDMSSREPYCSVDGIWNGKDVKNMDFGALKDLQSWKLGQYTEEFLWLGSSWICRKKRKHYQSYLRNGVKISIHDFVYVLAEEDKRLVAYLEDLYEDSRGNKMVVVRWFHKIDEEWILASRVAVPDPVGIRICGRTTVRPSSEYQRCNASCIGVGSVVDAWWHDGWWEGIVIKKDSEDKFHVYFPEEKLESVFGSGDVRQSREWIGNRWINIKERHDLVNSIFRGRKQVEGKSYDCNVEDTTICDGVQYGADGTDCNDSPVEPGSVGAKDVVVVVPDLSKDDLLSRLKWKSSRKRRNTTCVQKLNYSRNVIKATSGLVTCERFINPSSINVDNDNCKYMGDPLFCSSVVPPLASLVMTR